MWQDYGFVFCNTYGGFHESCVSAFFHCILQHLPKGLIIGVTYYRIVIRQLTFSELSSKILHTLAKKFML
jgi:hypothetical protein